MKQQGNASSQIFKIKFINFDFLPNKNLIKSFIDKKCFLLKNLILDESDRIPLWVAGIRPLGVVSTQQVFSFSERLA